MASLCSHRSATEAAAHTLRPNTITRAEHGAQLERGADTDSSATWGNVPPADLVLSLK